MRLKQKRITLKSNCVSWSLDLSEANSFAKKENNATGKRNTELFKLSAGIDRWGLHAQRYKKVQPSRVGLSSVYVRQKTTSDFRSYLPASPTRQTARKLTSQVRWPLL